MCERCKDNEYGSAYGLSESVTVKLKTFCPKCSRPLEKETHIHFGGECWQLYLGCPCGWGVCLDVHIGDVNKAKVVPIESK